ncbi:MAG: hypothetical protein RSE93_08090 [Oscillospiraceae bacterium]
MKKVLSVILMVAMGLSICSAIYASDSEWDDYEEPEKKVEINEIKKTNQPIKIVSQKETLTVLKGETKTIDKVVTKEEAESLAKENIIPTGILCDCGGNMDIFEQYVSIWAYIGNKPCPEGMCAHICKKYERVITTIWKCTECEIGHSESCRDYDSYCTY